MAIASFSYTTWAARYPELAPFVNEALATAYFFEACMFLNNTDSSPVTDANIRLVLLNMLVAHISKLNAYINGQAPSDLVGRVSSATEGSVSVSAEMNIARGSAQWFNQTRYGAEYWQATAVFRTAQYRPGKQYNPDPYSPLWMR